MCYDVRKSSIIDQGWWKCKLPIILWIMVRKCWSIKSPSTSPVATAWRLLPCSYVKFLQNLCESFEKSEAMYVVYRQKYCCYADQIVAITLLRVYNMQSSEFLDLSALQWSQSLWCCATVTSESWLHGLQVHLILILFKGIIIYVAQQKQILLYEHLHCPY